MENMYLTKMLIAVTIFFPEKHYFLPYIESILPFLSVPSISYHSDLLAPEYEIAKGVMYHVT